MQKEMREMGELLRKNSDAIEMMSKKIHRLLRPTLIELMMFFHANHGFGDETEDRLCVYGDDRIIYEQYDLISRTHEPLAEYTLDELQERLK